MFFRVEYVIDAQPKAAAVTKKEKRQDYRENKQDGQDLLIDRSCDQAVDQQRQEQRRFRGDDVYVNRADEVSLFALENQIAIVANLVHSK